MSYLPTQLPVRFYGLPDGHVYLIYARFYEVKYDRTYIEYVFAEHKEFTYDYEKEQLISLSKPERKLPVYSEMVDKPEPQIEILKIHRNINSFKEAFDLLNLRAQKMINNVDVKNDRKIQKLSDSDNKNLTASA